jgi:oligosaccharide repeat unit polymerase
LALFYSPLVLIIIGFSCTVFIAEKKIRFKRINIDITALARSSNIIRVIIYSNLSFSCLIITLSLLDAYRLGIDIQELRNTIYFAPNLVNPIFERISAIIWFGEGINLYTVFYCYYYFLFSKNIEHELNLALSSITLILYTLSLGGRGAFVTLIFIFLSSFIITKPIYDYNDTFKETIQNRKIFKKVSFSLIIFALLLVVVTVLRSLGNEGFPNPFTLVIDYYIKYFTGPFFAYDQFISTNSVELFQLDRFGVSLLGFDTIITSGLLRFLGLSQFLGLNEIQSLLSQSSYLMHGGIQISNDYRTNAFYTIFFTPYLDGGYLYIIIFLLFLGIIYGNIYRKAISNLSMHNFSFLMMSHIFAIDSVRTNSFQSPSFAICITILLATKLSTKFRIKSKSR